MSRIHAALLVGGVVALATFLVAWTLAALGTPGYDLISQFNSELGAGPSASIWNIGLIVLGLGTISFAVGQYYGLGRGTKIVAALLILAGAGAVGAGVFPCDPSCPTGGSGVNTLHTTFAVLAFGAIAFAPLAMAITLRRAGSHRAYQAYSWGTGILALVFFLILTPLSLQGPLGPWRGLIETMNVTIVWIAWMAGTAIWLLRSSSSINTSA